MKKPVIVLRVKPTQFDPLRGLGQTVYDNMNLNLNFPTPSPTMVLLLGAITAVVAAISKWGTKGNRGSHTDYVDLVGKAKKLYDMITEEAAYCMSIVDTNLPVEDQTTFLLSSGFQLKNAATPQGKLEMVQNFRRMSSPSLDFDEIKLKWKKPLNLNSKGNVKSYNVYRNTTNNIATASVIGSPTATSFLDTPGDGTWYYWVAGVNTNGEGVVSGVVIVSIAAAP